MKKRLLEILFYFIIALSTFAATVQETDDYEFLGGFTVNNGKPININGDELHDGNDFVIGGGGSVSVPDTWQILPNWGTRSYPATNNMVATTYLADDEITTVNTTNSLPALCIWHTFSTSSNTESREVNFTIPLGYSDTITNTWMFMANQPTGRVFFTRYYGESASSWTSSVITTANVYYTTTCVTTNEVEGSLSKWKITVRGNSNNATNHYQLGVTGLELSK